jgi:hypothetical protein
VARRAAVTARSASASAAGSGEPFQQRPADLLLHRLELVRQAGLGDEQPLGRPGERALINDRDQVFELPQGRHALSI